MSLRDSLRKLKTDYIDILYVHWWDWTTSIEEMMVRKQKGGMQSKQSIC